MKQKRKTVLLAAALMMILGVLSVNTVQASTGDVPIRGTGVIGQEQTESEPEETTATGGKTETGGKTGTGKSPKTGDSFNLVPWAAALAVSLLLIVCAVFVKRRQKLHQSKN